MEEYYAKEHQYIGTGKERENRSEQMKYMDESLISYVRPFPNWMFYFLFYLVKM